MATRVEIHNISKENKNYKVFDELTFNSRNLYNCCMYLERQFIFRNFVSDINWLDVDINSTKNKLSFKELYHLIRNNYEKDYSSLPSKIANQVLIQANEVFSNHFKAVKEYKLNPSKYTGSSPAERWVDTPSPGWPSGRPDPCTPHSGCSPPCRSSASIWPSRRGGSAVSSAGQRSRPGWHIPVRSIRTPPATRVCGWNNSRPLPHFATRVP